METVALILTPVGAALILLEFVLPGAVLGFIMLPPF